MKKFLVLYMSSVPAAKQMALASPEQTRAGMALWTAWSKEAGSALVDLGMPLGHPHRVTAQSPSTKSESKVTGFSVMQADSTEQIVKLLRSHPHHKAPDASIEILEFMPMPA